MLDFQIDKKTKELLREFVEELKVLNEHLADMKEMIADVTGFNVVKNKGVLDKDDCIKENR